MLNTGDLQNLEHHLGQASVTAALPDPVTEWVMILVRPGLEQEARDSLRRRGVGAWWPNYQKEEGFKDQQTGKRLKRLIRSGVLPGVLLSPARLDTRFWAACDLAPGVINVMRNASTVPIVLGELDIAFIHTIEAGLNKAAIIKSGAHSYEVGESVRFIDDIYRRLPAGKVSQCMRDGHVRVDTNFFGIMRPVDVWPWQIEPIETRGENQIAVKSSDARDRPAKSPSRRRKS